MNVEFIPTQPPYFVDVVSIDDGAIEVTQTFPDLRVAMDVAWRVYLPPRHKAAVHDSDGIWIASKSDAAAP